MSRRNTSQVVIIHDLLKEGVKVNPQMALNRCGCFRLASVIHILRKQHGEDYIKTNRIKSHTGNVYAEYSLA